jgi:hypothetical protein
MLWYQVFETASPYVKVEADVEHNINQFNYFEHLHLPPSAGAYKVVVVG